jgi:hypothetical protein
MYKDQLENRVAVREEEFLHPPPHPFLQQASGEIFEDDVNGFSSTADICFMVYCVSGIINYDFD